MAISKNKGPLLTSKFRGGVDDFPKEFLALIGIDMLVQEVPVDIEPDSIVGLLIESKTEQERDNERKKTNTFFTEFPDDELVSEVRLDSGLVGTRTRRLVPDLTDLIVGSLTESGDQHNLGNGWLDETIVEAPELFPHYQRSRERPVVTPQDFRASLQERSDALNIEGPVPVIPPLVPGETSITVDQYDVFNYRATIKTIDIADIPDFRINFRTNQVKQIEQVTRFLVYDDTIPTVPTATRDVTFTKLGDGTALEEVVDIEDIFERQVYEKSRPEVWPERFRAQTPLLTFKQREEGIAGPPVMAPDTVRISEQQEDEFVKLVDESVRDLPSLPTVPLFGQRYEDTFDIVIPYREWIDTAGVNIGSPRTVVVPQGDGTEQVEELDFTSLAAALDAYSLVFPGTTNLNNKLPDVLTELASVFEVNSGNGTYSETGAGYWSIRGAYSLSIRGSGNGSAAVVSDANFLLTPPFKPSAKTKRVVFFLPNPVSTTDVLTKLSTILGVSVQDWPDFNPTPVTVVCTSRKVSVRAEANQHTQSGGSSLGQEDPCEEGECVSCDAASTSGTGTSTEVGITIKTIRIPSCLHGTINLNDTQDENATAQAYAFDGSSSGDCNPPAYAPADTGLITLTASGSVVCNATATSETGYPTGTFLLDTSAQPYKANRAMVHAEVVDL